MRKLPSAGMFIGVRVLIAALFALASLLLVPSVQAAGGCGCMDVAFVIDNTGSMGGAINNVKAELPAIIGTAQAVSCGDLRVGLVTFPNDNVVVSQPLTTDITAVENAIQALVASGGAGEPESSDESLQYVITGAADPSCSVIAANGPFGAFRPGCLKMAILITDARPGECNDAFDPTNSPAHAHQVAVDALASNVLVSAILIPDDPTLDPIIRPIMQDYATTSGGVFVETESDGVGTGEGIANIVATCGGTAPVSQQCVTRNARFWFTHAYPTSTSACPSLCVDLLDATKINGGELDLGFTRLPTTYRDGDNLLDANDALIEALGFFWRSNARTGEDNGTQNLKLSASALCRARKLLAVELIAATANVRLLDTQPSKCFNAATGTNFPSNLLQQARVAASNEDVAACLAMTKLLKQFNNTGTTNGFVGSLVECSVTKTKLLKNASRDPTLHDTCPGVNDSCGTAEAIISLPFKRTVDLRNYTDSIPLPTICSNNASGGQNAVWKLSPPFAAPGRLFVAKTGGSNFATMLSLWQGTCSNMVNIACSVNCGISPQACLEFTTDGTSTYYVVAEGTQGGYGKLKFRLDDH